MNLLSNNTSVDWCEPNFYWTNYIAEFKNTFTNLIYIYYGMFGLYNMCTSCGKDKQQWEKISYVNLIFLGVGSILYHGTMTVIGQILDEVSMIYLLYSMYSLTLSRVFEIKSYMRDLSGLTVIYLVSPFYIFLLSYQLACLYVLKHIFAQVCLGITEPALRVHTRTIIRGVSVLFLSTILWFIDHFACDIYPLDQRTWKYSFCHSLWHLLSGYGTFNIIRGITRHNLSKK